MGIPLVCCVRGHSIPVGHQQLGDPKAHLADGDDCDGGECHRAVLTLLYFTYIKQIRNTTSISMQQYSVSSCPVSRWTCCHMQLMLVTQLGNGIVAGDFSPTGDSAPCGIAEQQPCIRMDK